MFCELSCLKLLSFVVRTLAVGAEIYKVNVVVRNTGDDAYNAKLYVVIPKGINRRAVLDTSAEVIVNVLQLFIPSFDNVNANATI